jgi:hypothetical protein
MRRHIESTYHDHIDDGKKCGPEPRVDGGHHKVRNELFVAVTEVSESMHTDGQTLTHEFIPVRRLSNSMHMIIAIATSTTAVHIWIDMSRYFSVASSVGSSVTLHTNGY